MTTISKFLLSPGLSFFPPSILDYRVLFWLFLDYHHFQSVKMEKTGIKYQGTKCLKKLTPPHDTFILYDKKKGRQISNTKIYILVGIFKKKT